MAESNLVSVESPSYRGWHSGEPIAHIASLMVGHPPEDHTGKIRIPYEGNVLAGREAGPQQQPATRGLPTEQAELRTPICGADVLALIRYDDTRERSIRNWGLVLDAQIEGVAARFAREWGSLPASVPIHLAVEADAFRYISALDSEAALIAYLRERERITVADRIEEFLALLAEEPDEVPIAMESLRSLVVFVLMTPHLRAPIVGADREGLMELEWHLADDGDPDNFWGRGERCSVFEISYVGSYPVRGTVRASSEGSRTFAKAGGINKRIYASFSWRIRFKDKDNACLILAILSPVRISWPDGAGIVTLRETGLK